MYKHYRRQRVKAFSRTKSPFYPCIISNILTIAYLNLLYFQVWAAKVECPFIWTGWLDSITVVEWDILWPWEKVREESIPGPLRMFLMPREGPEDGILGRGLLILLIRYYFTIYILTLLLHNYINLSRKQNFGFIFKYSDYFALYNTIQALLIFYSSIFYNNSKRSIITKYVAVSSIFFTKIVPQYNICINISIWKKYLKYYFVEKNEMQQ